MHVDCIVTYYAKETFDANCNYLCKEYRDGEGTFSRSTVLPISLQVAALLVVQQIGNRCQPQPTSFIVFVLNRENISN